jgi:GMP synthase (glutamine-hydrolysing)
VIGKDLREHKFLLLQVRDADDPMKPQEVGCFSRALGCAQTQIAIHDLLLGPPTLEQLASVDVVLLGGSGDYSVAEGGSWLEPALIGMRELVETGTPTFASCWGFQAMAKALGGEVITDVAHAELGSIEVQLTEAGKNDPLFGPLGDRFLAPMGHQDCVVRLPRNAVLLASSKRVRNQAFKVKDKPIYCTQFHPELNRDEFLQRLVAYPQYVRRLSGLPMEQFMETYVETVETGKLLPRFVQQLTRQNVV